MKCFSRNVKLYGGFVLFRICCTCSGEQLSIAIPPLANAAGSNFTCWEHTIPSLIGDQLIPLKAVRILPDSTIEFALANLDIEPGRLMTSDQALKLGRICEARRVVWGNYERDGTNWHLNLQAINVATGKAAQVRTASAGRLNDAISLAVSNLLERFNLTVSNNGVRVTEAPPTESEEALTLFAKGTDTLNRGGLVDTAVVDLRAALSIDANFVLAQLALAHCLMVQNNWAEAEKIAKSVLIKHSDSSGAHAALGLVLLNEGLSDLARDHLLRATELDPHVAYYASILGETYMKQGDWKGASAILQGAAKSSPFDARLHAQLGYCYERLQRRTEASAELIMAESYNASKEPLVEDLLAECYQLLGDTVKSINHYKNFLASADASGAQGEQFESARKTLRNLEMTLSPHPVTIGVLQDFNQAELDNHLSTTLTPAEVKLVINPVACSTAMARWAREVVGDAGNEFEKAKRLFVGLARRINTGDNEARRTAMEAYRDWSDAQAKFMCQDYTFLYVSLARSVGLKAYYVLVRRDYSGKFVGHACAAVLMNGEAFLVDPAYNWFGIPHKQFEPENDLRVVALYMCQSHEPEKIRAAIKIAPDWNELRFDAVIDFLHNNDLTNAKEQIESGLRLDSESWQAHFMKAVLEDLGHNWSAAEAHIRECLDINPDAPRARILLARELFAEGKKEEARDELERILQRDPTPGEAAEAREGIAYANETLTYDLKPWKR